MTAAAASKRESWVNRAWYIQPETANRLKAHVNRQQESGKNIDASDIVNQALIVFLDESGDGLGATAAELTDLVDLVVTLKDEVSDLQTWRTSQQKPKEDWVENLRSKIKQKHGKGWIIRQHSKTKANPNGKFQLTKIQENRKRHSVILPLPWTESSVSVAMEWIDCIRKEMETRGYSFSEAFKYLSNL